MATGGAIKSLILDGLNFPLSSDNDANFSKGGEYITEVQNTTGGPFFLVDNINGALKGIELRAVPGSSEYDTAESAMKKSVSNPITAKAVFANGGSFTAKGGARIVVSGAEDGMATTREGKLVIDIIPESGEWAKS